jgi:hypothetical protein
VLFVISTIFISGNLKYQKETLLAQAIIGAAHKGRKALPISIKKVRLLEQGSVEWSLRFKSLKLLTVCMIGVGDINKR